MASKKQIKIPTNNESIHQTIFEKIKEIDENGNEFWGARKLSKILEYSEFRHYSPVINKAKKACLKSNLSLNDHFEEYLEEINKSNKK